MRTPIRRLVPAAAPLLALLLALGACRSGQGPDTAPDVLAAGHAPAPLLAALEQANRAYAAHPDAAVLRDRPALAESQSPPVAVLACADSRVAPEWVFGQLPGRLFVVRDAGNSADTNGVASLEYAVAKLGTRAIVVLGHTHCGALKAAASGQDPGTPALRELVASLEPAVAAHRATASGEALVEAAIEENVRRTVAALPARSDLLRDAAAKGDLRIVGGVLDLATGEVHWLRVD